MTNLGVFLPFRVPDTAEAVAAKHLALHWGALALGEDEAIHQGLCGCCRVVSWWFKNLRSSYVGRKSGDISTSVQWWNLYTGVV